MTNWIVSYFLPLSEIERQISLSNDAISSRLAVIEKLQVKLLKRNFGVILTEKLVINSEFPIINYQIWKGRSVYQMMQSPKDLQ